MSRVQGMEIHCPEGWSDRSMLVLTAAPGASGISPNLVVTRETLAGSGQAPADIVRRVEAHVAEEIARWQGKPGYEALMRRHATPKNLSAEIRLIWTDGAAPLAQWLTFIAAAPDGIVVAAATASRGEMTALEPRFHAMLETLRLT